MTDVFISYSKSHRALTEALARDLEAQGLDVWWDTELLAGESFRERILAELKTCKAAIVIWTPESVRSAYVLSEAERARREGKLVQVRTADLDPNDLPPPFDTSHVPLIDDTRSIYGGLARLGLLDAKSLGVANVTPRPAPALGWRRYAVPLAVAALAVAGLVGLGTTGWMRQQSPPAPGAHPAAVAIDRLFRGLDAKLEASTMFAPNVRLGRLGAMSAGEAVGELRKLFEQNTKVSCRREGASPAPATPARTKADGGERLTLTVVCDLTDNERKTTTRSFPLEIETTRGESGPVIAGLWQPEEQVLWQPRPRR